MNIIDFRKICLDKHNRAYFLRVHPDDLKVTLSQIFYVLSDLSWISSFDEEYIRESFQERAKATLADIYAKITTSSTDEVSSDAGEYVVSELAREAIVDKLGYLDIPLAELYNKKKQRFYITSSVPGNYYCGGKYMKDIIQQIMNQENLDEIYGYAQNALFKDGPVSITTLEILSYLKLFAPDYFTAVEEEILSIMGIFYKKPTARTLQSKLFELYSEHIRQTYHHDYTPVQANILKQIQANQHFSFSAPTSTGKSHVFRHLIETSKRDVAIIVPSRALINEYYDRICELISDKSVNILTFVDIINTRHSNRTVFILTPERAKELFKHKDTMHPACLSICARALLSTMGLFHCKHDSF